MKKFRFTIITTLITLISIVSLISGCQKKNGNPLNETFLIYEPESKLNYDVSNPFQLNKLVMDIANEKGVIQIINAKVKLVTDQKRRSF